MKIIECNNCHQTNATDQRHLSDKTQNNQQQQQKCCDFQLQLQQHK